MKAPRSRLPFALTGFRAICQRHSTFKDGASVSISVRATFPTAAKASAQALDI